MAVRIGELLLKEKRITPEQLQEALNYPRQNGGKLGYNLIKLGYAKAEEVIALLRKQDRLPTAAPTPSAATSPACPRSRSRSSRSAPLWSSSFPPRPRRSTRSFRSRAPARR